MKLHWQYILITALATTKMQARASTQDVDNLKFEQIPNEPMFQSDGSTKLTYRASKNDPAFGSLRLWVKLGDSLIQASGRHGNVTVIYNGCRDSNHPDWFCKEAQITLNGTQNFEYLSLDLYKNEKTSVEIKRNLTEVKIVDMVKNVVLTTISSTNEPYSSDPFTSTTEPSSSNPFPHKLGELEVTSFSLGLMIALILSVLLIIVLLIVIFCSCVCLRRPNKISDVEQHQTGEVITNSSEE